MLDKINNLTLEDMLKIGFYTARLQAEVSNFFLSMYVGATHDTNYVYLYKYIIPTDVYSNMAIKTLENAQKNARKETRIKPKLNDYNFKEGAKSGLIKGLKNSAIYSGAGFAAGTGLRFFLLNQ